LGASRAVVMVTHDPRIAAYADRIVFLKDGAIVNETHFAAEHWQRGSGGGQDEGDEMTLCKGCAAIQTRVRRCGQQ